MTTCTWACVRPTPSQAHCGTCHETFGGVTGFDVHRKGGQCQTPKGYVLTGGIWRLPMNEGYRARLAGDHG